MLQTILESTNKPMVISGWEKGQRLPMESATTDGEGIEQVADKQNFVTARDCERNKQYRH